MKWITSIGYAAHDSKNDWVPLESIKHTPDEVNEWITATYSDGKRRQEFKVVMVTVRPIIR